MSVPAGWGRRAGKDKRKSYYPPPRTCSTALSLILRALQRTPLICSQARGPLSTAPSLIGRQALPLHPSSRRARREHGREHGTQCVPSALRCSTDNCTFHREVSRSRVLFHFRSQAVSFCSDHSLVSARAVETTPFSLISLPHISKRKSDNVKRAIMELQNNESRCRLPS